MLVKFYIMPSYPGDLPFFMDLAAFSNSSIEKMSLRTALSRSSRVGGERYKKGWGVLTLHALFRIKVLKVVFQILIYLPDQQGECLLNYTMRRLSSNCNVSSPN